MPQELQEVKSIVSNIHRDNRIKKILIFFCLISFISGFLVFVFYIFNRAEQSIRFISKYEDNKFSMERVMVNPNIKFEYMNNQFLDVKASRAVNRDKQDVMLFDVKAYGDIGNITSKELLITNNGNDLYFTKKPIFVIKNIEKIR